MTQMMGSFEKRLLLICTHPQQYTGYSKVVYNLLNVGCKMYPNILFIVYGFQKHNLNHRTIESKNVVLYDAAKAEGVPNGFGVENIGDIVKMTTPDVIWIYNDAYVISNFLKQIIGKTLESTKIALYFDQVYPFTRPEYRDMFNKHVHHMFCFTESWEAEIKRQGIKCETSVMHHGFNITKTNSFVSRKKLGLPEKAFLILNLNRNQPRKRWDVCVMSFVEFMKSQPETPVFLIVGTSNEGAWNIRDIFNDVCMRELVTFSYDPLLFVQNPQLMSDEVVTDLYNATDVGLNTCDGEGYGLCNIEQAAVGKPQVVSNLGGLKDLLGNTPGHELIDPVAHYYVDNTRDAIGGRGGILDPKEVATGLKRVYDRWREGNTTVDSPSLCSWEDMVTHMVETLQMV